MSLAFRKASVSSIDSASLDFVESAYSIERVEFGGLTKVRSAVREGKVEYTIMYCSKLRSWSPEGGVPRRCDLASPRSIPVCSMQSHLMTEAAGCFLRKASTLPQYNSTRNRGQRD